MCILKHKIDKVAKCWRDDGVNDIAKNIKGLSSCDNCYCKNIFLELVLTI